MLHTIAKQLQICVVPICRNMQIRLKMTSITSQFLIMISISLVFGLLAFLYSLLGSFEQYKNVNGPPMYAVDTQEIGGHFLFGFIVGIPTRNLKIATLTGLMALTIDFDHLLFVAGSHIQSRIAHSILLLLFLQS